MLYNIKFWEPVIQRRFIKQIDLFYQSVENRLIPTFNSIDQEAEKVTEERWKELCSSTCSPDVDPADLAETARDDGIDYYCMLSAIKQTLLNISATGMYHFFEQQIIYILRKEVLHPMEEDEVSLMKVSVFKKRLFSNGINIENFVSWSKINELRLLSNTIKHAEGSSAQELREIRPDLFSSPLIRDTELQPLGGKPASAIYMPLSGEDIYVDKKDLVEYKEAIKSFWGYFIKECNNRSRDDTLNLAGSGDDKKPAAPDQPVNKDGESGDGQSPDNMLPL